MYASTSTRRAAGGARGLDLDKALAGCLIAVRQNMPLTVIAAARAGLHGQAQMTASAPDSCGWPVVNAFVQYLLLPGRWLACLPANQDFGVEVVKASAAIADLVFNPAQPGNRGLAGGLLVPGLLILCAGGGGNQQGNYCSGCLAPMGRVQEQAH